MVLGIERSGWTPVKRNLVMAVCILPMTGVHLLPALEILGVLAGLVVLDFMVIEGAGRRSWKNLLIGILIVIGTVLGVVLNPDFAVMKDIAANNGGLALPYFQKIGRFGGLAAFVMALSCALIFVWWKTEDRDKYDFIPIKYIGLYGASVGLLCILQFVALRFGIGSEYAVKKYAFGIETILLLEAAVLAALLFRSLSRKWLDSRKFADSPGGFLLILLLTSGCYYCALPYNSTNAFDTSDLVSLERQIRSIRDTVLPNLPNKSDIVLDIPGFPTSVNYMLSIGLLKTPRDLAARIIMTPQPSDLAKIGSIVTAEGSPYNIPECRRLSLRSSLVLLDGGCVADRKVR
jgi:hypothetical protein